MKNILIYGDSNTWGYDSARYVPEADAFQRMDETERWPCLVRTMLGSGYHVIEDALNGRTLMWDDPYMPGRNGLKGLQTALDAHAPLDLVVLQLGCNELKDYFNLSAAMIARGMETLVRQCGVSYYGYPAPKVLLIAPAPTHPDIAAIRAGSSFGPTAYPKSCELGKLYRAIAERHGCGFIDCAALDFEINTVDGLHYSRADHARLAPVVAEKIREMLGESATHDVRRDTGMIVLNVTYKCKPGKRYAFLKKIMAEGIEAASRADAGNIRYDYFIPTDGSDDLFLLEKWRDADALAEHGRQPHIGRLKAIKAEFVIDTIIEKYQVE